MLDKKNAVALYDKYENLLNSYMQELRRGDRVSDMYCSFPTVFEALLSLKKNDEQNYKGFLRYETQDRQVLGVSQEPLEVVEIFGTYYSQNEFSLQLRDDLDNQQLMDRLIEFYNELSALCTPTPTLLYKSRFSDELALKFPSKNSRDNFVAMMGTTVGATYADKPTVLFTPGKVEDGYLVATFPTLALREEAINLLGLTE